MNAFSPGRVAVWHTSLASFLPPYQAYRDLGVTDIFFDLDDPALTVQRMGEVRTQDSADGKKFRPQGFKVWRGQNGGVFARELLENIAKYKPGVCELDFEGGADIPLGESVTSFLAVFRDPTVAWRIAFPLCINVVPMKGYVLPIAQMAANPLCYVRVQRYYGAEMRPAEPSLCRDDIVGRGFPPERFSFMESAKPRRLSNGVLFCDLPIFSDGGAKVRNLSGGAIYNSNLLREGGLA